MITAAIQERDESTRDLSGTQLMGKDIRFLQLMTFPLHYLIYTSTDKHIEDSLPSPHHLQMLYRGEKISLPDVLTDALPTQTHSREFDASIDPLPLSGRIVYIPAFIVRRPVLYLLFFRHGRHRFGYWLCGRSRLYYQPPPGFLRGIMTEGPPEIV